MVQVTIDQDLCIGCEACVNACPNGVFKMNNEGKAYVAEKEQCVACKECEETCPVGAISVDE